MVDIYVYFYLNGLNGHIRGCSLTLCEVVWIRLKCQCQTHYMSLNDTCHECEGVFMNVHDCYH